jgi:hypothetical protein
MAAVRGRKEIGVSGAKFAALGLSPANNPILALARLAGRRFGPGDARPDAALPPARRRAAATLPRRGFAAPRVGRMIAFLRLAMSSSPCGAADAFL